MKIESDSSFLEISDNGVVTHLSVGEVYPLTVPVYPFVFKEHSFYDTQCKHLDDTSTIHVTEQCDSSITFVKKFGDFPARFNIRMFPDGFDYEMNLPDMRGFRYGVVIPCSSEETTSLGDTLLCPISNFHRTFERTYRDQQIIKLPVVTWEWESKFVSVFLPMAYNSQFFVHNQGDENCIRISVHNDQTESMKIHLRVLATQDGAQTLYSNMFKESRAVIHKRDSQYQTLSDKYGVQIITEVDKDIFSDVAPLIQWQRATSSQLESYTHTLVSELLIYSRDFFKKVDLDRIVLTSTIIDSDGKEFMGLLNGRDIVLNISPSISEFLKRRTIHHEIFHLIENSFPEIKNVANENYFLSMDPEENHCETRAEIYSLMITNGALLQQHTSENIKKDVDAIRNLVDDLGILSPIIINAEVLSLSKRDDNKPQKIFLVGCPFSGFNLVTSVLNASPETSLIFPSVCHLLSKVAADAKTYHGLDVEQTIDNYDNSICDKPRNIRVYPIPICGRDISLLRSLDCLQNVKVIWIVRNPISILNSHPEFSIRDWFDVNSSINDMFPDKYTLRYEDFVMNGPESLFGYLGLEFDDQFLSYGDFDRPNFLRSDNEYFVKGFVDKESICSKRRTPSLKNTWDQIESYPLIESLGYQWIEE